MYTMFYNTTSLSILYSVLPPLFLTNMNLIIKICMYLLLPYFLDNQNMSKSAQHPVQGQSTLSDIFVSYEPI